MLVEAVSADHDLAEFRFDHPTLRADPLVAAKQAVADLERRHETILVRLADPDLSDMAVAGLKRALAALELELAEAQATVDEVEDAGRRGPFTHDDTFVIEDLAQLAAILASGVPVPAKTAERAARLLRTMLHDPRLILDPASASIRIEATLMLANSTGVLGIPLQGSVPNRSSDPWLAGVAGMWWERRTVPFAELMAERGLATDPGAATRWRRHAADRLLQDAAARGRPLRGPNLAALVRCPDSAVLERIRTAIESGTADDLLHRFLFHGSDLPAGQRWSSAAAALESPDEHA